MGDLFQRKPVASFNSGATHGITLRRTLGPWSLMALGIGAIIGAGLFSLTGMAAAEHAGPAVVLSFIVAATGCAFAGMCYSELASMIPVAGSAYSYAYATMGELVAWIIGWELVLEYAVGAATVSTSWSGYVVKLLHGWGVNLPAAFTLSPFETATLEDGSVVAGTANLPALLVIVMISLLLMRGIKESAAVNAVIVVVKLAVVAAVIGFGAFYIDQQNYQPFIPDNTGTFGQFGWSGILRAAGMIFFAYIGFDAVSTAAQETRNPQRDMSIGILGSLAICTVLYVAFALVLTGVVNYHELDSKTAVMIAIDRTPYHWLQLAVTLGIIAGFTTVILVMLLGQSRVFYSMSLDGLLPPIFSRIHPLWRTPWLSNLLFMVFTGAIATFTPIKLLGELTSIGTLLAFVIVCIGVLILRRTHPDLERGYRVPFAPVFPILGVVVCFSMMAALDWDTWELAMLWLVVGLVAYFGYGKRHSLLTGS
jgi:APA family basic amino acid/polyamine antiporter